MMEYAMATRGTNFVEFGLEIKYASVVINSQLFRTLGLALKSSTL